MHVDVEQFHAGLTHARGGTALTFGAWGKLWGSPTRAEGPRGQGLFHTKEGAHPRAEGPDHFPPSWADLSAHPRARRDPEQVRFRHQVGGLTHARGGTPFGATRGGWQGVTRARMGPRRAI